MALPTVPTFGPNELPSETKLNQLATAVLFTETNPLTAVKTVDQSKTSTTTLGNDNELLLSVAANATYLVMATILYEAATASDIKWAFTWPTGATMPWGQLALDLAATTFLGDLRPAAFGAPASGDNLSAGGAGAGAQLLALLRGTLTTSSTAGTLQFQFAQLVSGGTASIVKAGSTLEARRVA